MEVIEVTFLDLKPQSKLYEFWVQIKVMDFSFDFYAMLICSFHSQGKRRGVCTYINILYDSELTLIYLTKP